MGRSQTTEPRDLYNASWYPVPYEEVYYYEASAAIQEGQAVELTTTDNEAGMKVQPASANSVRVVGIATHDAVAGSPVAVQSGGVYPTVRASGAISAGAQVVAAASGQVAASASPSVGQVIGVATAAASGGRVPVYLKQA